MFDNFNTIHNYYINYKVKGVLFKYNYGLFLRYFVSDEFQAL